MAITSLDPLVQKAIEHALGQYAPEFFDAYESKDIKEIVKWLERKHRELKTIYPWLFKHFEESIGWGIGKGLGDIWNNRYDSCSPNEKEKWDRDRWIHHGCLGFLLYWWGKNGRKKENRFFIGLGNGLKKSDERDKDKWLDSNCEKAFSELKGMQLRKK